MLEVISIQEKRPQINAYWNPAVLAEFNGQHVRMAKFKGRFDRHMHETSDEVFWVLEGRLVIHTDHRKLVLEAGEMAVIPRGTLHQPEARDETWVLLFEAAETRNTGHIQSSRTRETLKRI